MYRERDKVKRDKRGDPILRSEDAEIFRLNQIRSSALNNETIVEEMSNDELKKIFEKLKKWELQDADLIL